jgi:hypothetical protein
MLAMVTLGIIERARIKVPDRYRYFLPAGDTFKRAKWDVLAQLGRINHAPMLRYFADEICKLNCPAKDAVRLVRKWHHSVLRQISLAPLEGRRVDIQLFAYQACHRTEYERPKDWRRELREFRSVLRRKE